jgi:formate hydrogenlyase transcriptional activator
MSLFSGDQYASDTGSVVVPQSLEEWKELLHTESAATDVGLGILDADLRFIEVNTVLAKMNGILAQEHPGESLRAIMGDLAEGWESLLDKIIRTGQVVLNREFAATLPHGSVPVHRVGHYFPIKGEGGDVQQIGMVMLDITEQRQLGDLFRSLSESLRIEKRRGQMMVEVSRLLTIGGEIQEAFPLVSSYVRRALRHEYAALWLRDEKAPRLVRRAMDFPLRKILSGEAELSGPRDPETRALAERSPLILSKADMVGLRSENVDHLLTEGMQSLCCVPLVRPKGALGVVVLGSTRADAFQPDDLAVLNQVAAQLAIALENSATSQEVARLKKLVGQEKDYLEETGTSMHFEGIVGESRALCRVLGQVGVVAESDATVLLLGETGTGKGLIAKAIHSSSKRKHNAFVAVNCAAIPTGLLESELFGHEKGAFTGAIRQKMGRLELADKGTLVLDEIGEISPELQPKLLRVLQDQEFERLGGIRTIKVDIRLIAATNRDLAKSVVEKEFRSDLFYRLNVFPIRVPLLRERREDIPALVYYFVRKFGARMNRVIETIPKQTMNALIDWDWPGNIRELENFVERSVILTEGTVLRAPLTELKTETASGDEDSLKTAEREHIIQVLRRTGGRIAGQAGAARWLGVKRSTLQSKMERLRITPRDYAEDNLE